MKCKKIVYLDPSKDDPMVLYGITSETKDFFMIRTRKRAYQVNRKQVLSITDTEIEFEGDKDEYFK